MARQPVPQQPPNPFARRVRADADRGNTLVELLVSIGLIGLLGVIGNGMLHRINQGADEQVQRTHVATQIDDANGQLQRDVGDGQSLRLADGNHLVLTVIRDGNCQIRDYLADPTVTKTLVVVTTFFETRSCSGASVDRKVILMDRYIQPVSFTYWGQSPSIPIPTPASDLRNVERIEWALGASPYVNRTAAPVTLMSAQVFRGLGEATGTGVAQLQGGRPLLAVTTAVPGKDQPTISWTDPTPSLTSGWVITRSHNPEGAIDASYLIAQPWVDGATLTWTDPVVAAGERATYVVHAILKDNTSGPGSNSVDTGIRPATPAGVTATGAATSITVTWAATSGATSYDVYRDGTLVANVGAVLTWTDALDYGSAHVYQVTATNRWGQRLETGTETGRVPLGDAVTQPYGGGTRLASAITAASGAFTAPAAPTLTATPNADWSNSVTVTFAAWAGAGPTTKAGVSRDRGWTTQSATLSGAFGALWAESTAASQTHAARPAGASTRYQAQACNASGCGPFGAPVSALQRPATPASCTPSSQSTRGMTVTVTAGAQEAVITMYRLAGGTGAPTGTGDQAGATFAIDQLTHATTNTWTVQTQNGSPAGGGWSDPTTCQGTTATLGVSIDSTSATTRSITANMSTTNGSSSTLTLDNVHTYDNVTSATWDGLTDNTAENVTAQNTDGYNTVTATSAVSTQLLAAPSQPNCVATVTTVDAPGAMTITASGGSGTKQVRLGSGGLVYTLSAQAYSNLSAGTYTGYVRSYVTDGVNTAWTLWDNCTGVINNPYPTPWGVRDGCPGIAVYVSPGASYTYNVRRTGVNACQGRMVVTQAGADLGVGAYQDVVALYSNTVTAPSAWVKTSGSSAAPSTLPWAP